MSTLTPRINDIEDKIETKNQTKILSTNVSGTNTFVTELQFNNLEIGKFYRVSGNYYTAIPTGDTSQGMFFIDGTNFGDRVVGRVHISSDPADGGSHWCTPFSWVFQMTDSTTLKVYSSATTSATIYGDGTRQLTFATLEELPNHVETTDWD